MSRIPLLVLAGAALSACAPPLLIVSQATPNPFRGGARYAVDPVGFSELEVRGKSEDDYLMHTGRATREWEKDKRTLASEIIEGVMEGAKALKPLHGPIDDADYMVMIEVEDVDPGKRLASVRVRAMITDSVGSVLDEVVADASQQKPSKTPLVDVARRVGGKIGAYLAGRAAAKR